MRITLISDTHNKHKQITGDLPGGDLLVHSGDISSMGYEHEIREFCKWFTGIEGYTHKVFIAGNHDWGFQDNVEKVKEILDFYTGITYLQDSVVIKYKNCDCDVYIPNSFTPNDDDRNDVFSPIFQCEYNYFSLTIFDRWGNTVYTSTNINAKWDGKFKGNPCPDDVYVYRLEAIQRGNDKKLVRNVHIYLFR